MRSSSEPARGHGRWAEIEQRIAQVLLLDPAKQAENAPDCSDRSWDWLWNVEEDSIFFSERVRELLGCSPQQLRNCFHDWLDRVHPDDEPHVKERCAAFFDGQSESLELQFRLRKADGTYLAFSTRAQAVKRNGRTEQLFGHYIVLESNAKRSQDLEAIIHSVPCGVSMFDVHGRFEFVNEAFAEALGYTSDQLVGHPWDEVILEDDQGAAKQTYATMLETGKSTFECRLRHKSGNPLRMDLMLVKRKAADNTCAGHFCFCKTLDQESWAKAS